ncbi:MAG: hypothetical protein Q4D37_11160, partial [Oscillospiraceae bacterium]|nr:hypothetical protein [Oscillospiraceae bacterium]
MIKINDIKLPVGYQEEMVTAAIAKKLHLKNIDGIKWIYYRKSIDARKKDHIQYNLSVLVSHPKEKSILQRIHAKNDV